MNARWLLLLGLCTTMAGAAVTSGTTSTTSPIIAPPVDGGGGPDAWGYSYLDSDTSCPGAPTFNWIDIRSQGVRVTGLADDNLAGPFVFGFEFPLYWLHYSTFFIGSNGYLALDDDWNSSHPFPDIPAVQRPNNLIAGFMSDIDFTGLTNGRGCWFWKNPAADTLIVQCESVPFWNVPGSNNTFEIILSKPDGSITYQYLEQTGAPYLGWGPDNITIGIENITGQVGLRYNYGNSPSQNIIHPNLAVRFQPPQNPTYNVTDVMIKNTMSHFSTGIFLHYPIIQPTIVWARIKNSGTQAVSDVPLSAEIYRLRGDSLVWSGAGIVPHMDVGFETTFAFGSWAPSETSTYTLKVRTNLLSDEFRHNDSVDIEIHVVNYNFPTTLSYDPSNTGSTSLLGPHGYAVKFAPPRYPVRIARTYFYFTSSSPVTVCIMDDDGYNTGPGTVIDTAVWTPHAGWDSLDMPLDSTNFQSGSFFVGFKTSSQYPAIGTDNTMPHSRQNWEWTGAWAPHRFNEFRDLKIRARVILGTSQHNMGVTEILAPAGVFDSGVAVTPAARVRNVGTSNENQARVTFTIPCSPTYAQTQTITLNHGRDTVVSFPVWNARPGFGFVPRCSTYVSGDLDPENDTLSGAPFDVRYTDLGCAAIEQPADTIECGATVQPRVRIGNFGNTAENVPVRFRIPGAGYADTASVYVGVGSASTVRFRSWTADSGSFALRCSTEHALDMNPANDLCLGRVFVRYADVQPGAIVAPPDTVALNRPSFPVVSLSNNGNAPATFNVALRIEGEGYSRTCPATLPAHSSDTILFPGWIPSVLGPHLAVCSTQYSLDREPANDRVTKPVYVTSQVADVGVVEIVSPAGTIDTGTVLNPTARWHNFSGFTTDLIAFFIVTNPAGTRVYTESRTVTALGPGLDTLLAFAEFGPGADTGQWTARCSTYSSRDTIARNDVMERAFRVAKPGRTSWPAGWHEVAPVPLAPSNKQVKDGCWVTFMPGTGQFYAAKGNKTADFYSYDPLADEWTQRCAIPAGAENRLPKKGATACADGGRYVYAAKGNNSVGFWRYDVATDTWTPLANIRLGTGRKKVKGGTDAVFVVQNDTDYVYLLKGYKSEFYRYRIADDSWLSLADAPAGAHAKWDKGSWLVYDGSNTIYAHKAKYHELHSYDLATASWAKDELNGMPLRSGITGRNKKSKEGSTAAWFDGAIYALKGGNTQEFWKYLASGDSWTELETIPQYGTTGKRKRVKAGADMAAYGQGAFFTTKGNKTLEFWRYVIAGSDRPQGSAGGGVLSVPVDAHNLSFTIAPNPMTTGFATVRYTLPAAGYAELRILDITGRVLLCRRLLGRSGVAGLDLRALSSGVYVATLKSSTFMATSKLIVE